MSCTKAHISVTFGTSWTLLWLVVPWWRSPSRKCHQGSSAHASLLSPFLLAASPRPFPSCSLQVKRLCSRNSSLPPWSASLLSIQTSSLSLSLSPFFSFSPFLCLSLLPQLSSLHLAYLDPLFPSPYPSPHSAPVLLFGDFSLHLLSLPHHALHFAQCPPSGCAWAHFHEGDDPTWAPVTL